MTTFQIEKLPPDTTRFIQGFVKPALTNETIMYTIRDYCSGGDRKSKIIYLFNR